MPTQKIVQMVTSCGGCDHCRYDSGNTYDCRLTGETVRDRNVIAAFCPLPDFPSRKLADMETTIALLREPNKYGMAMAVLSHVAAKLNTSLGASGHVELKLKDEGSVYLMASHILSMTSQPWTIVFMFDNKKYKLYVDTKPDLSMAVTLQGRQEEGWQHCELE